MALVAILFLAGFDETADSILFLSLALPIFIPLLPIALAPMIVVVGAATGASPVMTQQAWLYLKHNWRGAIGWILLASSAVSLVPIVRMVTG